MCQNWLLSVIFCHFNWRVIASQYYMLISGYAGHIYSWLAIARQEKIATLLGVNGHNSKNRKQEDKYNTANFGSLVGAGCQNLLFYICLLIFYIWNCIHAHLSRGDFFLASDSEPAIYVSGEAGHQYIMLARYRSPGKDARK